MLLYFFYTSCHFLAYCVHIEVADDSYPFLIFTLSSLNKGLTKLNNLLFFPATYAKAKILSVKDRPFLSLSLTIVLKAFGFVQPRFHYSCAI